MTLGRIIVGLLLLAAVGVLIKLLLFLLGIYQPSPANIQPFGPAPRAIEPAAPAPEPEPVPAPEPLPSLTPEAAPSPAPVGSQAVPAEPEALKAPEPAPSPAPEAAPARPEAPEAELEKTGEAVARPLAAMPSSAETAANDGASVQYVVQPGDTLWAIARRSCGAGARYRVIYRSNRQEIRNPHRIWPQQVIEIPNNCR